jgi:hypothetical protein
MGMNMGFGGGMGGMGMGGMGYGVNMGGWWNDWISFLINKNRLNEAKIITILEIYK